MLPITNTWQLIAASACTGLLCGWLLTLLYFSIKHKRITREQQQQREELLQRLTRAETQLQAEHHGYQEKLALIDEQRHLLKQQFQALSSRALAENNRNFLDLAKTTLDSYQVQARGDLASRQQAIDQLVQPLLDSLLKVDGKIEQLEQNRVGAYARLDEQLKTLAAGHVRLQDETGNLVRALRTPTVRGRWGEIQLRKVVEMAGMLNYCDFAEQESADGGRLRPDLIIKLPNQRNIVVDAKAPLLAYLDALEAGDDERKKEHTARYARHIRDHLQKLSAKKYWEQFQPTPEFVVLFLPGESFFSAALSEDPALIEAGVDQKVLLATPTTLIALLRSVAYGWKQEQLSANAEQISGLGREIHDRLATLNQHFIQMGKSLEKTVDSYNRGIASLDSRVMVSARKFKELGTASSKELEPLEQIEKMPRSPQEEI